MIHRYLPMSGLMRTRSLSGLLLTEMTPPLQAVLGQYPLEPLSVGRLPLVLRQKLGTRRAGEWIEDLMRHSDSLKRSGLCCLLLDTLQHVQAEDAHRIAPLLQRLLDHGIQIVVMDHSKSPMLLSPQPDISPTDHILDIYVRSLLQQSQALTQSQQQAAERAREARQARQQAGLRFSLPERIFVP